jgi:uncharacterized UPF0160 family protein
MLNKINIFKKRKKLVTHNGSFHVDDIFATATLLLLLEKRGEKAKIIRTRDEKIIKSGDFVYDVGGIYDEKLNRFDHHQVGGAGKRENGIEYSSFGLVWKKFGKELSGNDYDIWNLIDRELVAPIDASDNGIDLITPRIDKIVPCEIERMFLIYAPTWEEGQDQNDKVFVKQAEKAKCFMNRMIQVAKSDIKGKRILIDAYNQTEDKKIVIVDQALPRYLYQKVLSDLSEPIYIVYKSEHSDTWKVEAIRKNQNTMESRKLFPESWRGYFNGEDEFVKITGISDVLFCHRTGFLVTTKSKESAIKLAKIALES